MGTVGLAGWTSVLVAVLAGFATVGCGGLECGAGARELGDKCVPAYEEIECGPGTVAEAGECVPLEEDELECGPGTVEQDGECVPEEDLECGPGTVEQDGECVPESELECGPGTVPRGDECVAADLQFVRLPFEQGAMVDISQGNHGYFSHYDNSVHAVDFPCSEGTTIVAARRGVVKSLYEDSDTGCPDPDCADDGNYVIIDHGDATFGRYWHLQQGGALVGVGDQVQRGEPIGLSGNTGWSTGPHLHFVVADVFGYSLPLFVEEFGDLTNGVPNSGITVESDNEQLDEPGEVGYSNCPADIFLHMGVELTSEVPCSVATYGVTYTVAGMAWSDDGYMMVARWLSSSSDWDYNCVPLQSDGTFATTVSWSSAETNGSSYLMIAAAESDCSTYQGWDASPWIRVW
ncbi:MAG: M23 family metallopeptidase [Deltaproteobacteria bacterium]|nr:M23 family metallopeptidase [Deltaproteobacteria bacterium]